MNASNHLRRAVSSLTRERKGPSSAITTKDRLQCLFRVLFGVVGRFNVCEAPFQCGRQSAFSQFVARQQMVNLSTPHIDCERVPGP